MSYRECLIVATVFLMAPNVFGQVDEAKKVAEGYCLDMTYGLDRYAVEIEIKAESSPDSKTLMESNCVVRSFKSPEFEYDQFECNPIFYDKPPVPIVLRSGEQILEPMGPFARDRHEWLITKGGLYEILHGKDGIVTRSMTPEVYAQMGGASFPRLLPGEWPLLHYSRMDQPNSWEQLIPYVFKTYDCESAEVSGDKVKSVWISKRKEGTKFGWRLTVTFEKEVVTNSKWELEDLVGKKKFVRAETETTWDFTGDSPVPSRVRSKFGVFRESFRTLDVDAKFQWYLPGTPGFDERREKLEKYAEKVSKKDRVIAGTGK